MKLVNGDNNAETVCAWTGMGKKPPSLVRMMDVRLGHIAVRTLVQCFFLGAISHELARAFAYAEEPLLNPFCATECGLAGGRGRRMNDWSGDQHGVFLSALITITPTIMVNYVSGWTICPK